MSSGPMNSESRSATSEALRGSHVVVVVVVGDQIRAEAKTSLRTPSVRVWANAEIARPYFPIPGHLATVKQQRELKVPVL